MGDCDYDHHCNGEAGLKCGKDNCDRYVYKSFDATDDCCYKG